MKKYVVMIISLCLIFTLFVSAGERYNAKYDVDDNGTVDAVDALKTLRYSIGLEDDSNQSSQQQNTDTSCIPVYLSHLMSGRTFDEFFQNTKNMIETKNFKEENSEYIEMVEQRKKLVSVSIDGYGLNGYFVEGNQSKFKGEYYIGFRYDSKKVFIVITPLSNEQLNWDVDKIGEFYNTCSDASLVEKRTYNGIECYATDYTADESGSAIVASMVWFRYDDFVITAVKRGSDANFRYSPWTDEQFNSINLEAVDIYEK